MNKVSQADRVEQHAVRDKKVSVIADRSERHVIKTRGRCLAGPIA